MRELMVTRLENGKPVLRPETIYRADELPLLEILLSCKTSKKRNCRYLEIPAAFDIETTSIYERLPSGRVDPGLRPYGFMYHWQLCIGSYVVFGRRWEEYLQAIQIISDGLHLSSEGTRLVVWVHNLPFEFAYLRRFINVVEGFYKAPYKPLRICTGDGIEYRDSLALSNMSLEAFCKASPGCDHVKLKDDLDYTKIRTADSFLTDTEQAYCYNDVRGLCECIAARMKEDTLASMPMTSTGYVRRDTRNAMRGLRHPGSRKEQQEIARRNRRLFQNCRLSPELYTLMRKAFRGGNTHANAAHANRILHDLDSYDITSSYPAVIMTEEFPVGAFTEYETDRFLKDQERRYCYLLQLYAEDLHYTGTCGIPYISISKVEKYDAGDGYQEDNGRIRSTAACWMWVTDIDYDIIKQTYSGRFTVGRVYAAQKGKLPQELRDTVMRYYQQKTTLKGKTDPDSEYMYSRYKALLNAIFGMMCTRLDMPKVEYHPSTDPNLEEFSVPDTSLEELLEGFYKSRNSFLAYQWGVWITAHARAHLERMLQAVGPDVVYCDTDSVKFLGSHDDVFQEENRRLQAIAEAAGAYADNEDGERFYLGTWDKERHMDTFKTLGAKKYVFTVDGQTYSTIAGVNKKRGGQYFAEHGLDAFRIGEIIPDSGHLVAYRNDDDIHEITVDGCTMTSASNLALVDDTYELGVTGTYLDLLEAISKEIEYIGGNDI